MVMDSAAIEAPGRMRNIGASILTKFRYASKKAAKHNRNINIVFCFENMM